MEVIDAIHGILGHPGTWFLAEKVLPDENGHPTAGQFIKCDPDDDHRRNMIYVSFSIEFQPTSFVHEVGHILDLHLARRLTSGDRASRHSEEFKEWREIVCATEGWKTLWARNNRCPENWSTGSYAYLLPMDETWARAYEQYICLRTNNSRLQAAMIAMRVDYGFHYWDDDDFVPVALEMDALFERLGWLKK